MSYHGPLGCDWAVLEYDAKTFNPWRDEALCLSVRINSVPGIGKGPTAQHKVAHD